MTKSVLLMTDRILYVSLMKHIELSLSILKKVQFSKDADANMKAMVSKPYAKVLKEAFPQATFVGFTGTPIAETYQTFGDEIDRYTMDQAVADGLTVSIKYHPRIAKVLLDNKKVKKLRIIIKNVLMMVQHMRILRRVRKQ